MTDSTVPTNSLPHVRDLQKQPAPDITPTDYHQHLEEPIRDSFLLDPCRSFGGRNAMQGIWVDHSAQELNDGHRDCPSRDVVIKWAIAKAEFEQLFRIIHSGFLASTIASVDVGKSRALSPVVSIMILNCRHKPCCQGDRGTIEVYVQ